MKPLVVTFLVVGIGQLYGQGVQLQMPRYGCPMAHCTPNLNDQIALKLPSSPKVVLTDLDSASSGSGRGLGCSSNGTIVACSFFAASRTDPGLKVYDGSGSILFTDQSVLSVPLTHYAQTSAPIVFGDASYPTNAVLAADDCHVALVEQIGSTWTQIWESAIPTCISAVPDSPVSPVPLGNATNANIFLFQTNHTGSIYTYNLQTGAILHSGTVQDAQGNVCISNNTPAVNDVSNTESDVYQIDQCKSQDGSVDYGAVVKVIVNLTNGIWTARILPLPASFNPPSYASPTFVNTTLPGCQTAGAVYFDSSPAASTGETVGVLGLVSGRNMLGEHAGSYQVSRKFQSQCSLRYCKRRSLGLGTSRILRCIYLRSRG